MTTYTYWGNKNENVNGTSVLIVASGEVDVGKSGDFTPAEYIYLVQNYDLRAGVLTWARTDFPWVRVDQAAQVSTGGGGGGSSFALPLDGGSASTSFTNIVDGGNASTTFTLTLNGGTA